MEKFIEIIKNSQLFVGFSGEQIMELLNYLSVRVKTYKKGSTILQQGQRAENIILLLKGVIIAEKIDYIGNTNIIKYFKAPEVIALAAYYSTINTIPFNCVGKTDCQVINVDISKIFNMNYSDTTYFYHIKIINNLLNIMADKNIQLTNKINTLTERSIRNKLLDYLKDQSVLQNKTSFDISLTRIQLAEYLSVDRCAMSREINKMQHEGIIVATNRHFILCDNKMQP